jgi:hypothetical protein
MLSINFMIENEIWSIQSYEGMERINISIILIVNLSPWLPSWLYRSVFVNDCKRIKT